MTTSKEAIVELLLSNDKAVERAVVAIWKYQTESEKQSRDTHKENGVGFNAADARALSLRAERLCRGLHLDPMELADSRHRLTKYAGQLFSIAVERELNKLCA